ncbi:TEF transcription factor, PAR bZIP family member b isoform X3 [Centroberyx affinis]|uniref:TEF transcription factor, PAR bZIP family member b isoform X3 n=1 Tax=Centroberyx affinis TaxID=166261 RepID=UPI003A5C0DE8
MPGKAAVATALQPSNVRAAPQKCFPFVLKKIMDIPPPNILEEGDDEIEKEKLAGGGSGGMAGGGGGGVSASLTPAIWEKTIPYDGETFHLEYMDLDEFLLENGIPVSLEEEELQKSLTPEEDKGKSIPKAPTTTTTTAAPAKMEEEEEEDDEDEEEEQEEEQESVSEEAAAERKTIGRNTPSPIDPEAIEVDINFQPDPTDLVLSSVPGGELFNPRKHKFSDEELKPQPMIKKAKKVFVPDEQKDDKYWSRRKKNNMAAKRSRDARRLKENQITVRASFLERENAALRQQVAELRKDCGRCKNVVARYEAKYGPL